MHESVAVANAAELFKLIFLSKSKAPEAPTLLAETLRRYSEHDLCAAFNYLREKKIMVSSIYVLLMAVAWHHTDELYGLRFMMPSVVTKGYGGTDLIISYASSYAILIKCRALV